MATVAPEVSPRPTGKLIAPLWHTALLVSIFAGITIAGVVFQRKAQATPGMLQTHPNVIPLYLSMMAAELGLVYGCWVGVHLRGGGFRDLIGGRWLSAKDVMVDIALAAVVWILWLGIQIGVSRLWGANSAKSMNVLTPQHSIEIVLWFVLCVTAGFAEEVAFRGYFQKQFQAMTGSAAMGLILQALLFGIAHGYQGSQAIVMIILFGLVYGFVAMQRKSLRPTILAHAWSDMYSGYLSRFFPI